MCVLIICMSFFYLANELHICMCVYHCGYVHKSVMNFIDMKMYVKMFAFSVFQAVSS